MNPAHIEIRRLSEIITSAISAVPAIPKDGSPRHRETLALRATAGGGGRARARLLEELSGECHLLASSLLLVADGVADYLELSAGRDNVVNFPVLTIVVRPVIEMAGQIAWLLDHGIDGAERVRRFIRWQFADLRDRRLLLRDFRPADDPAAVAEVDAEERALLETVAAAKWEGTPTVITSKGDIEAAGLLDANRNRERFPSTTSMVRLVSSTPSLYNLLSIPTHGTRLGTMYGVEIGDVVDRAGRRTVQIGGFGLDPNLAIGLTVLAMSASGRRVAGWNSIDDAPIITSSNALLRLAGLV